MFALGTKELHIFLPKYGINTGWKQSAYLPLTFPYNKVRYSYGGGAALSLLYSLNRRRVLSLLGNYSTLKVYNTFSRECLYISAPPPTKTIPPTLNTIHIIMCIQCSRKDFNLTFYYQYFFYFAVTVVCCSLSIFIHLCLYTHNHLK